MNKIQIPWAKPYIGKEEIAEVLDSFNNDWLSMGPKVKKFENIMASFLKVPYAIAVSNGTIALDLVLKTIGIKPGDEIIVPAMTYFATASAVSYQGAIPVFTDIDKDTYNLNPERISEAITKKTRAILFIDYGGNPSNYDEIFKVSSKYGIPLIQDGAQSLGAIYKGVPMGAQTEISTMSFHMAKILTTVEGGMIFTHNKNYYEEITIRRNQGESKDEKYIHIELGTNARMTDIQGGIGLAQFNKLPILLRERQRIANKYDELFSNFKNKVKVVSTLWKDSKNSYFFYPILIPNRDKISKALLNKYGIDTRIAYPVPVYKQSAYKKKKLECRYFSCPVAEEVTSKILNLPIYPFMKEGEIAKVFESIVKELKS